MDGSGIERSEIERQLRRVVDPELGVNILDLGLVYGIDVDAPSGTVHIDMTLTTPGCPLHGPMQEAVRKVIREVPGVRDVSVDLVWDPPWSPERIRPEGRRLLGWEDIPSPR